MRPVFVQILLDLHHFLSGNLCKNWSLSLYLEADKNENHKHQDFEVDEIGEKSHRRFFLVLLNKLLTYFQIEQDVIKMAPSKIMSF